MMGVGGQTLRRYLDLREAESEGERIRTVYNSVDVVSGAERHGGEKAPERGADAARRNCSGRRALET